MKKLFPFPWGLGDVPPLTFLGWLAYWFCWSLAHGLTTWTELP